MDRARRATYTPPTDGEAPKRGTVSERAAGKAERARASTLLALGLADEKEQALNQATLLSSEVDNKEAITSGNYTVQILGTDLAAKKAGKAFTVYKVEITQDISTWIIYRRYSQFYALLEELKGEHGKKVVKGFPPKKFIHNLSPASIDRRHQQLQDWLQTVLNDKWVVSSTALQLFIKAGKEDADFVPRQHASTINSDIDMATSLYKFDGSKWKSRWFVLRHGRLYKYSSPQSKHPYGFYDLRQARAMLLAEASDATIKNAKDFAFAVDCEQQTNATLKSKRYIFSATTDDIMKGWISCINQEFSRPEQNKVFGVPIAEVRDRDENGVPLFLSALLTFLEATALDQEDLFTKPPDEEIKRAIDRGKTLDLTKVAEDAHAVAGLIVQYLHELPDSIIPEDVCPSFYGLFQIKDQEKRLHMLTTLSEILPLVHRNLLIKLFSFLHLASQGAVKRGRLSKIFARIIFRVSGDHQLDLQGITEQLMDHWDTLVVADEVYAAPEKVLVVKKKKSHKTKKGASSASVAVSSDLRSGAKPSTDTPATGSAPKSSPVFNDFYDSNEEFEESSEEEEWTDDEVQVISEISEYSSDEEYDEEDDEDSEEEEYSEEGLIDELSKAAANIPDFASNAIPIAVPKSPTTTATANTIATSNESVSPPLTPKKKDDKDAKKAEKAAKEKADAEKLATEKAAAKEAKEAEKAAAKEAKEKADADKAAAKEAERVAKENERLAKENDRIAKEKEKTELEKASSKKPEKSDKKAPSTPNPTEKAPSSSDVASSEKIPSEKSTKDDKPSKTPSSTSVASTTSSAPEKTVSSKDLTSSAAKDPAATTKDSTSTELPDTPSKKHKRDKTVDKHVDKPSPSSKDGEAASSDKVAVEAKAESKKDPKAELSSVASSEATVAESETKTEGVESSSPAAKSTTSGSLKLSGKKPRKSGSSKRVRREPSRRPANVEVIAGVPTNNPVISLSLDGIDHEEQPIGSPSHRPLATPLSSRARKHTTTHSPSGAKSPHTLAQRTPEPTLTPQEQLVADLGRVLGRRPVGGVALFPMPVKK